MTLSIGANDAEHMLKVTNTFRESHDNFLKDPGVRAQYLSFCDQELV